VATKIFTSEGSTTLDVNPTEGKDAKDPKQTSQSSDKSAKHS